MRRQLRLGASSAPSTNGLTQVFIGRFPNALFTGHRRAINRMEPGGQQHLAGS
jgi:hypothetical protein